GVRAPRLRVALHHVRVTRQFLIDSKPARGVVHERVEPEHAAHERGQCIPHRIRPPQMHAFVRENERLLHLRVAHLEIGGQDEARPEHPDHRRTARGLLRAERATLLEQRAEASQASAPTAQAAAAHALPSIEDCGPMPPCVALAGDEVVAKSRGSSMSTLSGTWSAVAFIAPPGSSVASKAIGTHNHTTYATRAPKTRCAGLRISSATAAAPLDAIVSSISVRNSSCIVAQLRNETLAVGDVALGE